MESRETLHDLTITELVELSDFIAAEIDDTQKPKLNNLSDRFELVTDHLSMGEYDQAIKMITMAEVNKI